MSEIKFFSPPSESYTKSKWAVYLVSLFSILCLFSLCPPCVKFFYSYYRGQSSAKKISSNLLWLPQDEKWFSKNFGSFERGIDITTKPRINFWNPWDLMCILVFSLFFHNMKSLDIFSGQAHNFQQLTVHKLGLVTGSLLLWTYQVVLNWIWLEAVIMEKLIHI